MMKDSASFLELAVSTGTGTGLSIEAEECEEDPAGFIIQLGVPKKLFWKVLEDRSIKHGSKKGKKILTKTMCSVADITTMECAVVVISNQYLFFF